MYELYSIMVHSGGAYGGHYFAYIRDFAESVAPGEKPQWYCFNDSWVTSIPDAKLEEAFGDSRTGSTAGTSAYLLAYRRTDE
jgi:ubiquitin carboxyl-terminal hydrolase 47